MDIHSKLELNFFGEKEASISLENSTEGREEKFGDILMFCCFAIRTIVNFGNNPAAGKLVAGLDLAKEEIVKKKITVICNIDVVKNGNSEGDKGFVADLLCADESFRFVYDTKGFGFFAKGMDYYAPSAVFLLLQYLSEKHHGDKEFVQALKTSIEAIREAHYGQQLQIASQNRVALTLAMMSYEYEVS